MSNRHAGRHSFFSEINIHERIPAIGGFEHIICRHCLPGTALYSTSVSGSVSVRRTKNPDSEEEEENAWFLYESQDL